MLMSILHLWMGQGPIGVPIAEKDKKDPHFCRREDSLCFLVIPLGLCNAPSTFHRVMNSALCDMPHSLSFIDETLTYSH